MKKKTDIPQSSDPQLSNDSEGRRKLMKVIAAGGSAGAASGMLPTKWSKPLVDSVLLPAHAATSFNDPCGFINVVLGVNPTGTLVGTTNPPIAGVTVNAIIRLFNNGAQQGADLTPSAVTNASGAYQIPFSFAGQTGDQFTSEVTFADPSIGTEVARCSVTLAVESCVNTPASSGSDFPLAGLCSVGFDSNLVVTMNFPVTGATQGEVLVATALPPGANPGSAVANIPPVGNTYSVAVDGCQDPGNVNNGPGILTLPFRLEAPLTHITEDCSRLFQE